MKGFEWFYLFFICVFAAWIPYDFGKHGGIDVLLDFGFAASMTFCLHSSIRDRVKETE